MEFRVEAMHCRGCAHGVTRAIRSVDPVAGVAADVAADLGARRVLVTSARPRKDFLPALSGAGFHAG